MPVAKIRIYPDPVLQDQAAEIENIDGRVVKLARDMADTMYAAPGVGLAAPQIGFSERLICVDVRHPEEKKELITLINPVSERTSPVPSGSWCGAWI
jgi:peptide deformylase